VSFLRVARLFRLGRILRSFRMVKFLRSIRSMMISITGSIMHLVSAMLIMCMFMFVVALILMQGVAGDIQYFAVELNTDSRLLQSVFSDASGHSKIEEIMDLYGGIDRTMMTLFLTVSGGLEWSKAAEPVARLGTFYGFVWTCYIAFMVFGMLNVLTGIFVDTAMAAMNNDRDNMIADHVEEKNALISTISKVFESSDKDGSGMLTEEELAELLRNNEVMVYLNAIGIDSTEAQGLFQLLDDDASGTVSIDEFVTGFLRIKGGAKAVDMLSLMYENRKVSKKLNKIFKKTEDLQKALAIVNHRVTAQAVVDSSRSPRDQARGPGTQLLESIQAFGLNEMSLASRMLTFAHDEPNAATPQVVK